MSPEATRRRRAPDEIALFAAILAVLALGGATLLSATAARVPFAGFLAYEGGAVAPLRRHAWAGQSAGVAVRDVVVAVDGEPVRGGAALRAALATRVGRTALVETRRGDDPTPRRARLPVSLLGGADLAYTFVLPFSIGVLYLLGFASEGSKKARDAAAYYQRVFAIDIDFRDVSKRLKQMTKAATK